MNSVRTSNLSISIMRWLARIWSLLVFAVVVPILIPRDPFSVELAPDAPWSLLGSYALSVLGLAVAWRWEGVGGVVAIAGLPAYILRSLVTRGIWIADMRTTLVWIAFFALPGLIFLSAWSHSRARVSLRDSGSLLIQ